MIAIAVEASQRIAGEGEGISATEESASGQPDRRPTERTPERAGPGGPPGRWQRGQSAAAAHREQSTLPRGALSRGIGSGDRAPRRSALSHFRVRPPEDVEPAGPYQSRVSEARSLRKGCDRPSECPGARRWHSAVVERRRLVVVGRVQWLPSVGLVESPLNPGHTGVRVCFDVGLRVVGRRCWGGFGFARVMALPRGLTGALSSGRQP